MEVVSPTLSPALSQGMDGRDQGSGLGPWFWNEVQDWESFLLVQKHLCLRVWTAGSGFQAQHGQGVEPRTDYSLCFRFSPCPQNGSNRTS